MISVTVLTVNVGRTGSGFPVRVRNAMRQFLI